ncbi:MAG: dihydrolipoyl dehydrogenase [Bryobacteraceae bacterium]|nr:dihydrolipoyl dehydrogenase [Bryobacteraceae bacterium]
MHDLIVIGAGPGGYEAAAHAARLGAKVAIVEKDAIGGACLNVGCIPTKAFLRSSRLYAECRNAAAFGVEIDGLSFNLETVVKRKDRIVATLARGVDSLLKRAGVEVIHGEAKLASKNSVSVNGRTCPAKNILIATGSRPAVPPIPGIGSPGVLDSSGVLRLTRLPETVAIIGGGYIGLEFAGFFAAAGAKVTVLEMLTQIAAGADHDISSRLMQSLQKQGIEFKTSCTVTGIDGGALHYEHAGAPGSLAADCIVNATGRAPLVDGLGLAEIGLDFDRKGIRASDQGKTNIPGIWACGDVTGRRLLAHAATREGIVAVNNMFGKPCRIRYDAIPSVIYTHPEAASAGKTENELKALGVEYKKALLPMGVAGRFLVENESPSGTIKVLVGARYGEILGVHALGDLSSEFIAAAAAMIEMEMTVSDVEAVVFPHPTVSEALKLAILEAA